MKKVGICGFFARNTTYSGGQEIKTRSLADFLARNYDIDQVIEVDTLNWKKRPIQLLYQCIRMYTTCENIIFLPAHNGLKVFISLFLLLKSLKKRKIYYVVVGGWLPQLLSNNANLLNLIRRLDGVFVETETMRTALIQLGLCNVYLMPNGKQLDILDEKKMNTDFPYPRKLCTFSRVLEEKGIEDAIRSVMYINQKYGKVLYELDIYGKVDEKYSSQFLNLEKNFPKYIRYKGVVDYGNSVEVLKKYYLLLFPTKYYTEGIPGTIIDAYAAGVPVLCSKWESYSDIVEENITGFGYEFGMQNQMTDILNRLYIEDIDIVQMKKDCLKKSQKYTCEVAFQTMIQFLER